MTEMTANQLAERLSITKRRALDLSRAGSVTGRQLDNGMWLADSDSVARYELSGAWGSGRTLDSATAWGLLWELSGLDADWLADRTRARVRRRIREMTADEIATAVASRSRAHRYSSANVQLAASRLIRTGRSAAGNLASDLIDDDQSVCGYVREGSVAEYARVHLTVLATNGRDVLYENTLPIEYDGEVMPNAVVAADLAMSTNTRERSAGLRALEEMRQQWLDAHPRR